jgi:hypothetical protein
MTDFELIVQEGKLFKVKKAIRLGANISENDFDCIRIASRNSDWHIVEYLITTYQSSLK